MTEAVVAESATSTSRPSVEDVYRRDHRHMWRALLAYSGDPDVASDAESEAFAQAIRRGEAIRHVDRWVWKAAFRIAAGMLKERSRYSAETDAAVDGESYDGDLGWALRRLSPNQRASVFLRYYGGYAPADIARMIGSTPGAVRVHLFRGRKRLESILTEVEHG